MLFDYFHYYCEIGVMNFGNRWGKIRMLEPYQPKFIDAPRGSLAVPLVVPGSNVSPLVVHQQQSRPSYPLIDYPTISKHQVIKLKLNNQLFIAIGGKGHKLHMMENVSISSIDRSIELLDTVRLNLVLYGFTFCLLLWRRNGMATTIISHDTTSRD